MRIVKSISGWYPLYLSNFCFHDKVLEAGCFIMKRGLFCFTFLGAQSQVEAFTNDFVADSAHGGSGHHMVRDKDHACKSLLITFPLLIKPPRCYHRIPTFMTLPNTNTNHVPKTASDPHCLLSVYLLRTIGV